MTSYGWSTSINRVGIFEVCLIDMFVACTNFSSDEDINWKLSRTVSCPMLNAIYFSAMFAMHVMLHEVTAIQFAL